MASPSISPLRILVLDDDDGVRDVLTRLLRTRGHSVEATNSGRKALAIFQRGKFDVVITDQTMPEMSGDAFAAAIKARAPTQPVIMFTGNAVFPVYRLQANVDCLIPKPARIEDLFEAIALVTSNTDISNC